MLWSVSEIRGFRLRATDGDIGEVSDLLFEDATSTVRYLVADTGSWLASRKVLIAPEALRDPDTAARAFPVGLTREQVENSPGIETDRPVSRQREDELRTYYGWRPYWNKPLPTGSDEAGAGAANIAYWGRAHREMLGAEIDRRRELAGARPTEDNPHLRSASEVIGYCIEATDGEIGHVEDLLAESGSWIIRYAVVDTRNWWPGKKVLVAPEWMKRVDWDTQRVGVDLTRGMIKSAPEYEGSPAQVDREFERRLYRHYGQSPYESPAPA